LVLRRRPEKPEEDERAANRSAENAVLKIEARMDALDRRLDNIDSMVTAVAERVMNRPVLINTTCPHCGKNMEIALIGTSKPAK
jgi:hypothetical protein